jgi:tRNA G18 (ribose-2'-O)-methylase SpoU
MKKNKPSSSYNRPSDKPRSAGRTKAKPDSRTQETRNKQFSKPGFKSRSDSRPDGKFQPRSENPDSSTGRQRPAGRSDSRPEGRFQPRSEGKAPFSDRQRPAGRSDSRPEGRFQPRSEGRAPFSDRQRPAGRSDSRGDEKFQPKDYFSSSRQEGKFHSRSEDRPLPAGRSGYKPEGRFPPRSDTRPQESRNRPFKSDKPQRDKPFKSDKPQKDKPKSTGKPNHSFKPNKNLEVKPFTAFRKDPESPELKYYGFHACLNLFKARPDDIIRVYVDESIVKDVGVLLKWCAAEAKAYHVVTEEEMAKVSDSVHHEGLCILAKEPKNLSFSEMLEDLNASDEPACLLYLDGVQNPHNIGSIMRVSAHFGIKYILGQKNLLPKVSPSAYRVAQGGAEYVKLIAIDDIKNSFKDLEQAGFSTVATSSHGNNSLYNFEFSPRMVIVMGSESEGVNEVLMASTKDTLLIPGSGVVESLNVSVATGLILGEYFRQVIAK